MSNRRHSSPTLRRLRVVSWGLSILFFVLGFWVGWNINAEVGIGLWVASAAAALVPFATHRTHV